MMTTRPTTRGSRHQNTNLTRSPPGLKPGVRRATYPRSGLRVKRILINRAGTVENCPTTTRAAATNTRGRERNNPIHEQQCSKTE
jgi:hypothetical protein